MFLISLKKEHTVYNFIQSRRGYVLCIISISLLFASKYLQHLYQLYVFLNNVLCTKVKVKLSLWFNRTPRHGGVLGSGGIGPRVLVLGTRWRWVVSFTPRKLYPRKRAPATHWIGGRTGLRAVLDAVAKRNIPSPAENRTPIIRSSHDNKN
jgi:hypothetical protein